MSHTFFVDIMCETFFKKRSSKQKCCFSNEEYSLIHKFEFYEHKLVCCSFLLNASNGISFGINKHEINPEYQTNYTTLHERFCET